MEALKAMVVGAARQGTQLLRISSLVVAIVWAQACHGAGDREGEQATSAPALRADAPASDVGLPAAAPVAAIGGPKVVFLGDSLSAGLHLRADQAFPALLQRRLFARGVPFQLLNAGVSGDTTAGGARRVDWVLKQKPDIVVVELGANDGMRGIALSDVEQNLRTIVAKIRASGAQPLLLGMRVPPSYGAQYANGFAAIYPRLASELALPFVPFFLEGVAGVPELNLPDGIHPTAAGHERIAEHLLDPLKALITRESGVAQP
jgi:acyl-CoA thioesterase-1